MSSTIVEPLPATSTKVYTKEELEALKRALARLAGGRFGQEDDPGNDPENDIPWQNDIDSLVQFLTGLKRLMRFLIAKRVPKQPRAVFLECLGDVEANIDNAIDELKSIDSATHPLYRALRRLGLAGKTLFLKLGEFGNRIATGPVVAVLEMADNILGSLMKVLTQLEPVKEFKEIVESRIKHGADQEIIDLGL